MRITTVILKYIEKIKSNPNFKNGILFTLFAFLNNGISFILLLLLAGHLTPDSYGYLNLFNTSITILTILLPLGSISLVGITYFSKPKSEFKKIISVVFLISTVIFIILSILFFILSSKLENVLGFSYKYQLIILLICYFQIFNTANLDIWRLREEPVKYGLYSLGIALTNLVLSLLLVISFKMDWLGRVYAQVIVLFIFFVISVIFFIHRQLISFKGLNSMLKESLKFGLPLIPHQISSWLRQGLDRYIINFFNGATSVGLFSLAFNFGNIIHIVGLAFNASNSVFIYKNLAKDDDKNSIRHKLYKQTYVMTLFFFLFTVAVFLGSYIFIPYLFPQYEPAKPFLFPICFASFFQCIYYLFVNYLFYYKKTKTIMAITISVSILHLALSFLFTRYSTLYTAYISFFSNFLICILIIFYSQKTYPLKKINFLKNKENSQYDKN